MNNTKPSQTDLNKLLMYFKNGNYVNAEKLALILTKDYPKYQFSWKVLGAIYTQTDRKNEALNAKKISVDLAPIDAEAHYNLGATLQELGKLEDAELSYRKAIDLKLSYPKVHYNLGIILQEFGKIEDAELCYRKAIELNPDYYQSRSLLGVLLLELGKHNEGIKEKAKSDGSISFDLKNGLSIC